jgi:hypothetical protein
VRSMSLAVSVFTPCAARSTKRPGSYWNESSK